jgi:hypothetical protein
MNKRKQFYIRVGELEDENFGMSANSFVANPAVQFEKFTYSKVEDKLFYAKDEEQIFFGVSILADVPIPQKLKNGEIVDTIFTKEEIKLIGKKNSIYGNDAVLNYNHNDDNPIEGVYLIEKFFLDKGRIESPIFNDVTDGSLMTSYFVPDKEQFLKFKNDPNFNGFSIEINTYLEEVEQEMDFSFSKEDGLSDFARAVLSEIGNKKK